MGSVVEGARGWVNCNFSINDTFNTFIYLFIYYLSGGGRGRVGNEAIGEEIVGWLADWVVGRIVDSSRISNHT